MAGAWGESWVRTCVVREPHGTQPPSDRRLARGGRHLWALPMGTLDETRPRPPGQTPETPFPLSRAGLPALPLCCFPPPCPRREHRLRLPVPAEGAQADGACGPLRGCGAPEPPPVCRLPAGSCLQREPLSGPAGKEEVASWAAGRARGLDVPLSSPGLCYSTPDAMSGFIFVSASSNPGRWPSRPRRGKKHAPSPTTSHRSQR